MEDFGCDTPEFVLIFRTQVFVINLHFSSSSKFEFFANIVGSELATNL